MAYPLIMLLMVSSVPQSSFAKEDDMVLIPAGEFTMGSNSSANSWERPEHIVYLNDYQIDKDEVTVDQYTMCVNAKKCRPIPNMKYFKPGQPIREVSWHDAVSYCQWVGKRLPTEAEWERAARGPKGYINPWGNEDLKKDAINDDLNILVDISGYGVKNMAGGVSEWVEDWYSDDYYKMSPYKNPKGPSKVGKSSMSRELERTVRGSNKRDILRGERISYFATLRWGVPPNIGVDFIGFRCAKSVSEKIR